LSAAETIIAHFTLVATQALSFGKRRADVRRYLLALTANAPENPGHDCAIE
jgi:hypothetical protein